jgi:hypothetical protein
MIDHQNRKVKGRKFTAFVEKAVEKAVEIAEKFLFVMGFEQNG